jgi:hypothetical protein
MMPASYEDAWRGYQDALGALYQDGSTALAERGDRSVRVGPGLEVRADAVIDRSGQLGSAAEAGLAADDLAVRELAELQLVAAAALDLLVADDLARADENAVAVAERSSVGPPRELFEILRTPQEAGIAAVLGPDRTGERWGGSGDAREDVMTAVDAVLEDILDEAAKAGATLTVGLLEISVLPLKEAAAAAGHELLEQLGDRISLMLRKAVALVVKAIEKLASVLGRDARDAAREEAVDWLDRLKKGEVLRALLTLLYEPKRIKADVREMVEGGPANEQVLREIAARLDELGVRFAKHRKAIDWLARGLAIVRGWLLSLQPWGPIALVSAHVTALGYVVYLGGDYSDWYRTGSSKRLDFVPGVRAIVRQGMLGDA